jgi:release factor glutamine methyltransferase
VTWPDPTDVGDVYQPAEDSDLLARAAREQVAPGDRILEVGTGSGYVAGSVAETAGSVVASDVNPHACRQARENYGPPADGGVTVVRGDLTTTFRDGSFDVVLFNPPYLPTDADEERDDWMATALSGGESGRAVIDRFLEDVGRVLDPEGFALVLVSSLAGVEAVVETADGFGFSAAAVLEESYPFETLSILKLVR